MDVPFTKMEGLGNDYVYVDVFASRVDDAAALARAVSRRHFGVGADGLILIAPPKAPSAAVCRMEMYNADGSRGAMCGNGLRCVAKFVYDRGRTRGESFAIETDSGPRHVRVATASGGRANSIEVDMGAPRLARGEVPMHVGDDPTARAVDIPLVVDGRTFRVSALSMGNPHVVIRLETPVDEFALEEWGPRFEHHPAFPDRVNAEFIFVRSPTEFEFRVWERGSGETLACGSGACAAVVAAVLNGWTERAVRVQLRGGALDIHWEADRAGTTGRVAMTGPATEVFSGVWPNGSR